MKEEWAANVIGKMHRLGIKQKDLAKRCGYSAPYLCTVLCGKKLYLETVPRIQIPKIPRVKNLENVSDPVKMQLVEETAICTDRELYSYILAAVTEGRSYTYLRGVKGIPCGKDYFYERYRKFFWLLSKSQKLQGV